jgi:uncharacterized protein (TIRG00374 family)
MKKYYHFIGLFILAVILTRIDYHKLITVFSKINLLLFSLSNILIIPFLFIKAYRWRYILRLQGIDYSMRDSFLSYLGGVYAGIITPGRIGEAIKALYLRRDKNVLLAEGFVSIFIDRFLDLYLLALFGSLGLLSFINLQGAGYIVLVAIVVALVVVAPSLLFNKYILEKIAAFVYASMIYKIDKNILKGQFKIFLAGVKKVIANGIFVPFVLTILSYLIFFAQCYVLIRLIPIGLSYIGVIFLVSISNIVSILPITVFGLGVREVSMIYLLSLRNIPAEPALTYSFLLFVSFYVINGVVAFMGWHAKGMTGKATVALGFAGWFLKTKHKNNEEGG